MSWKSPTQTTLSGKVGAADRLTSSACAWLSRVWTPLLRRHRTSVRVSAAAQRVRACAHWCILSLRYVFQLACGVPVPGNMIYKTLAISMAIGANAWSTRTAPTSNRAAVRSGNSPLMMARTPLIAGNWKMNTVLPEALSLAKEVADAAAGAEGVDVAVCVPFPFLVPVGEVLKGTKVGLGAQDCYYEDAGAYTGVPGRAQGFCTLTARNQPCLPGRLNHCLWRSLHAPLLLLRLQRLCPPRC